MQVAIQKRARHDAPHCGDDCASWETSGKVLLCVVDGLGHGEYAEKAAHMAVEYVSHHLSDPLPAIFAGCDAALRKTRGVALGIARIDSAAGVLTYAAIGNTRAILISDRAIRIGSDYGVVGAGYKKLNLETVPLKAGDVIVLFTDGLEELIDVSRYTEAVLADARKLAPTLLDHWRRPADDDAVLVYRHQVA